MNGIHFRWVRRSDLPRLLEIDPGWSKEKFLSSLREQRTIGMVAEDRETQSVLGFVVYDLYNHLEIIRLRVHPGHYRKGVGRALIEMLVGKLSSPFRAPRTAITVSIRHDNIPVRLFLEKTGFKAVCSIREEYQYVYGEFKKDNYHV